MFTITTVCKPSGIIESGFAIGLGGLQGLARSFCWNGEFGGFLLRICYCLELCMKEKTYNAKVSLVFMIVVQH